MELKEGCVQVAVEADGVNIEGRPLSRQNGEGCLDTVERFSVCEVLVRTNYKSFINMLAEGQSRSYTNK